MGALHLFEFSFSSSTLDLEKLISNIVKWVEAPVLKGMLTSFVGNLQIEGSTRERIQSFVKTRRRGLTRGLGLLYFLVLEEYLSVVDKYVLDALAEHQIKGWWDRSFSTGVLHLAFLTESRQ